VCPSANALEPKPAAPRTVGRLSLCAGVHHSERAAMKGKALVFTLVSYALVVAMMFLIWHLLQ
jgi:hypothetical protein